MDNRHLRKLTSAPGISAITAIIFVALLLGLVGSYRGFDGDMAEGLIYLLFGLGAGVYLFVDGFSEYRKYQLILQTPTSKVRAIAMGQVELYGTVVPAKEKLLTSPLEKKRCVYYSAIVEELRSSGKRSEWHAIFEERKELPFFLEDETGTVLVDPTQAEYELREDFSWKSGWRRETPRTLSSFFAAHKIVEGSGLGKRTLRCKELRIDPEDKVYLNGTAGKNPYVKSAMKNEEGIMLKKGAEDATYLIADRNEQELLKTQRWKVAGYLLGGGALILGCLFFLFLLTNIL